MRKILILALIVVIAIAFESCEKTGPEELELIGLEDPELRVTAKGELQKRIEERIKLVYTGKEDHSITLEDAEIMTAEYLSYNPDGPWPVFFGKEGIERVFAPDSIVGLRVNAGIDSITGQFSPFLTGVTTNSNNVYPAFGAKVASLAHLDARALRQAFRRTKAITWAWYFGGEAIETLLNQKGVNGFRVYGGINAEGQFSPVLVGVTADGEDIFSLGSSLRKGFSTAALDSVVILDIVMPCPPYCCLK